MRLLSLAGVALVGLGLVPVAKADSLLFDLDAVNGSTTRAAGSGVGQGVAVSTTTTLDGVAFDVGASSGANVKYMIFGADDQTLLTSQTTAVAASNTMQWVEMTGFDYTLLAGQTYFFGVIADNGLTISYLYPEMNYGANGLAALMTGNTNYSGYATPGAVGGGSTQIGLRLYGTQSPVAATPEPATMGLLGTGLLAGAGVVRRRMVRR